MQPGSLVECVNDMWIMPPTDHPHIKKGDIETVLFIHEVAGTRLEFVGKEDFLYKIENFREVQPPMDINIESLIEETITV